MKRSLEKLESSHFDLVIIGGGITGACLAHDAVLRGLSVALIEKNDFGAATSSASSKLLHGGIRYLQQGRFNKVRESALERVYFQTIAPHLTRYIPFIVPTHKAIKKSKLLMTAGMMAYQATCLGQDRYISDVGKRVPRWRYVSKPEIAELIPGYAPIDLTGGVLFYESHMHSSERMTLAFLETAANGGAVIANYVQAQAFIKNKQKVVGLQATDTLTGKALEIRGKVVVNAAGPWIPGFNEKSDQKASRGLVTGYSKGAHIITKPLTKGHAIALATQKQNQSIINRGGRHVFIIPWRGHSLIGTTYGAYEGNLDEVAPDENDIAELVADINAAIGNDVLSRSDVRHSYAGLYPLIDDDIDPKVYQGTGNYQVVDHLQKEGIDGLVTVFGAKFTTARLLAERALNMIVTKFDQSFDVCKTQETPLSMAKIEQLKNYKQAKIKAYQHQFSEETVDHLITNYGTAVDKISSLATQNPAWAEPLLSDELSDGLNDGLSHLKTIQAEVIYAVREEMACHLDDVVFRRTGLGTLGHPGVAALTRCADLMALELGWNEQAREAQLTRTLSRFFAVGAGISQSELGKVENA